MALSVKETWRPIDDFSNYEVSDLGRVRSNITGKILRQKNDRGYDRVQLYKDGVASSKCVHRLVGKAFLDNPSNKKEINHLDGDKRNNRVENLEWCTRSENLRHAFANGLKQPSGGLPKRRLEVVETGMIYDSVHECARRMKLDQGHINQCLSGQRKTHNRYHFRYVD